MSKPTEGRPPQPGTSDIEISSGAYLNLENPDPSVITLEVVAHHLSQMNRYAGAPKRPISVAEHALLVAAYLYKKNYPPYIVLSGLHHDDAEAFVQDISRPLKELIAPLYGPVEQRMMTAIAEALDFERLDIDVKHPAVKQADNWALAAEAFHYMPSRGEAWWCWGLYDPPNNTQSPFYYLWHVAELHPWWTRETQYSTEYSVQQLWISFHERLVLEINCL